MENKFIGNIIVVPINISIFALITAIHHRPIYTDLIIHRVHMARSVISP